MNPTFCEKMDRWLDAYCGRNRFAGILRVTHRDRILYQRCMGLADPESGIPVSEQTRFTFYSLSKPFCAIGLMKLVERGLVSMDCHPGKYVPEARDFDARVTVYHMLHHISGMPDFVRHPDNASFDGKNAVDMRRLVRELSGLPPVFAPGTATEYANINFALSALIIENVSGRPYADYMHDEVFAPLGMEHAVVDVPGKEIPHRAIGCGISGDSLIPVGNCIGWMFGAGDINGDVNDVYCLNRAIKNRSLLSNESWEAILTPAPINAFGCGCAVNLWHGRRRIQHNGGHVGFRTLHIQLPDEDFDIILLSNCGFGDSRNSISEAVYAAYFGAAEGTSGTLSMDTLSKDTLSMDKGYIAAIGSANGCERAMSEAEERRLLGRYGDIRLEKSRDGYRILRGGTVLECYFAGDRLVNRYADESYPITAGADGRPQLLAKAKSE